MRPVLEESLNAGIDCYVLRDDLAMRGIAKEQELTPGVKVFDYPDLVELMMERHDRVLGVF